MLSPRRWGSVGRRSRIAVSAVVVVGLVSLISLSLAREGNGPSISVSATGHRVKEGGATPLDAATLVQQANAICDAADSQLDQVSSNYSASAFQNHVSPSSLAFYTGLQIAQARALSTRLAGLADLVPPTELADEWNAFVQSIPQFYSALETQYSKAQSINDVAALEQGISQMPEFHAVYKGARSLGLTNCFAPSATTGTTTPATTPGTTTPGSTSPGSTTPGSTTPGEATPTT
jgi:hypothetical protein